MIRFNNILAAKDFSDCSEHALKAAVRLARATGATLHVVYVQVLHDDPFSPEAIHNHVDRIKEAIQRGVESLGEPLEGLRVEHAVLRDVAAAPALSRYAADNAIDIAVLGTHGRRGLRHAMLGSVAEEVVRTAPCPVLTVHRGDRVDVLTPGPDAEILLPLDFSSRSLKLVPIARELAEFTGARLRILHVVEEMLHPAFYNAGAFSIYDLQPDVEARALEHLKEAYAKTAGPVVPVTFDVIIGHAATEIVEIAQGQGAGMIVMSTQGLRGLSHLFMGSVAERVVRMAKCPVLTVRTPQEINQPPVALEESAAH